MEPTSTTPRFGKGGAKKKREVDNRRQRRRLSACSFALVLIHTGFEPKVVENRYSPVLNRGNSFSSAINSSVSGTRCATALPFLPFIRVAGIVHSRSRRFISD